jgi:hypothetical protein
MANGNVLTVDERKAVLETEISKEVRQGWRVISRTDTTAQLSKDVGPNGCVAIVLLLFLIVPGILYLLLFKGTESLYLEVDEQGAIKRTAG